MAGEDSSKLLRTAQFPEARLGEYGRPRTLGMLSSDSLFFPVYSCALKKKWIHSDWRSHRCQGAVLNLERENSMWHLDLLPTGISYPRIDREFASCGTRLAGPLSNAGSW